MGKGIVFYVCRISCFIHFLCGLERWFFLTGMHVSQGSDGSLPDCIPHTGRCFQWQKPGVRPLLQSQAPMSLSAGAALSARVRWVGDRRSAFRKKESESSLVVVGSLCLVQQRGTRVLVRWVVGWLAHSSGGRQAGRHHTQVFYVCGLFFFVRDQGCGRWTPASF